MAGHRPKERKEREKTFVIIDALLWHFVEERGGKKVSPLSGTIHHGYQLVTLSLVASE